MAAQFEPLKLTDLLGTAAFVLSVYNFGLHRWEKRPRLNIEIFTAFAERKSATSLERVMRMYSLSEVELTGVQNLMPVIVLTLTNGSDEPLSLMRRGTILPNKKRIYVDEQPSSPLVGMDLMPLDLQKDQKATTIITQESLAETLTDSGFSGQVRLRGFYEDRRGRKYISSSFIFDIDEAYSHRPMAVAAEG